MDEVCNFKRNHPVQTPSLAVQIRSLLMAGHGFLGALTGQSNEFINRRILVQAALLAVVNAHRCMGGFFLGKKNQFLMGQHQMLGNKSKACSGQS